MTRAEREEQAVRTRACPRCHREAGRRCVSADLRHSVMKHPHAERVALVPDEAPKIIWQHGDPSSFYHDVSCRCPDHCGNCFEDLIRMRAEGLVGQQARYCSDHCRRQMARERAFDRALAAGSA